jgi:hypothetical protein
MSEELTALDPIEIASFLDELTELTRRYGIEIWGCGCCGSPGLSRTHDSTARYRYHEHHTRVGQLMYLSAAEYAKEQIPERTTTK